NPNLPCPTVTLNQNVGKSRNMGLQFDSSYKLTAGFNIAGTLLLQDTKYLSGVVTDGRRGSPSGGTLQVDLTDNELPLTPHVTLNLRVGQTFGVPGGSMDWVVSATYKSSQFLTAFNGAPGHNGAKQVTGVDAAGVATARSGERRVGKWCLVCWWLRRDSAHHPLARWIYCVLYWLIK